MAVVRKSEAVIPVGGIGYVTRTALSSVWITSEWIASKIIVVARIRRHIGTEKSSGTPKAVCVKVEVIRVSR